MLERREHSFPGYDPIFEAFFGLLQREFFFLLGMDLCTDFLAGEAEGASLVVACLKKTQFQIREETKSGTRFCIGQGQRLWF
jgi:hypothetical protein